MNQSENTEAEDALVCGIILMCCIFGILTNSGLIYATWKSKTLKNPYGTLCTIIGGLNCCLVITATAYMITPIVYNGLMEANVSGIFNAIFYPIILLHLLISINRLCSISMPLKYTHIFGGKNSIIMAFSIIAISIAFWSGFNLYWECSAVFNKRVYSWLFKNEKCIKIFSMIDFHFQISIFIIIAFIDAVAFRLFLLLKKKNKQSTQSKHSSLSQLRTEIFFFSQTCVSTFIYVIVFVVDSIPVPIFGTDKWTLIVSNNISWVLGHAIDGIIIGLAQWNILLRSRKVAIISVQPMQIR